MNSQALIAQIRDGRNLTFGNRLKLTALLSMPSIAAQLSSILMQYIDAAMVGSLGAGPSASIGLVSTTTWLFWGLCGACTTGFSVQIAHLIGAGEEDKARKVARQALFSGLIFSLVLAIIGVCISSPLPGWLGGGDDIIDDAKIYFLIFSLSLPVFQIGYLAGGMLRCSGNMFVPGMLNVVMCLLDVIFNALLIYPSREMWGIPLPGAGLGVAGAALGTVSAELVIGIVMLLYLWRKSPQLRQIYLKGYWIPKIETIKKACKIGLPVAAERVIMCSAQILTTIIVAPLGTIAIAANAFAITAEGLCYMPGYGIGEAATTLAGQTHGAKRDDLGRSFANITVVSGIIVMAVMGVIMYLCAPALMHFFTPDPQVCLLGEEILRIEAWAEPMYGASIVVYGVFVGRGDTLVPSCMNLGSIWAVRITLAAIMAPIYGLKGVWMAMAIELTFRGLIFLARLYLWKPRKKKQIASS